MLIKDKNTVSRDLESYEGLRMFITVIKHIDDFISTMNTILRAFWECLLLFKIYFQYLITEGICDLIKDLIALKILCM